MKHIKPKNASQFQKAVETARSDGYQAIVPSGARPSGYSSAGSKRIRVSSIDDGDMSMVKQFAALDAVTQDLAPVMTETQPDGTTIQKPIPPCDGMRRGGIMGNSASMLDFSQRIVISTPDNVGTPGKGYVPWGNANNMPAMIYKVSSALPYTATGLQYLADTATGLGVRLMYHLSRYSGGTVTDEYIPYESAGVYLRERERELLRKISELDNGVTTSQRDNVTSNGVTTSQRGNDATLKDSYQAELDALRVKQQEWQRTMDWWVTFRDNNNLDQHFQSCMADDVRLDMCFPTVVLQQGRSGKWNPMITGVGKLDAIITRFEQPSQTDTDNEWLPRYVYQSDTWSGDPYSQRVESPTDLVAIPVTMPCHGLRHMREYIRNNQRTRVGERQREWCCPQYNPTPGKLYSQPSWWSIFPSQVFQYASTLIYDKSVARKNSTMWGKILFVNLSYLKQIFDQEGADTPEKQDEIREGIYAQVEDFLKRRDNNGKLLVMDSYMSADEKQLIDSIRIVDVPQEGTSKSIDGELSQITAIIYYALGIHPGLVGSDTTSSKGNSGTFQRELHLLKVTQMSPRQRRMLYFYNSILSFNQLDENAVFCVKQATLTTLDNSKTGMTETVQE